MATDRKTPGVYIQELDAFPNSVAQVETAIPAFIGYTPQAALNGKPCWFEPVKVHSMGEFLAVFGFSADPVTGQSPPQYAPSYYITQQKKAPAKGDYYTFNGNVYTIEPDPDTVYYLYNSVKLFFENGGTQAYIVSTGGYGPASGSPVDAGAAIVNLNVKLADLTKGLKALLKFPDVTLYVFPEATLLSSEENGTLMEETLLQCGNMQTAMAIFDVIGGRAPDPILWPQDIQVFRNNTGSNSLDRGVAYYPFLNTTAAAIDDITYGNLNGGKVTTLSELLNPASAPNPAVVKIIDSIVEGNKLTVRENNAALMNASKLYQQILGIVQAKVNILPPSGIMAGVYSLVDATKGVWTAPANVAPVGVTDVTIRLSDQDQAGLNVDAVSGKSINAIRFFNGRGVLVWGARTLDGNSQDWRYINVRRTITMIEQSAKHAVMAYVFEPNDANTWAAVKGMLDNFLTNLWRDGALQGAKPSDAFAVQIGLGSTMTAQDVLDNLMRVNVMVAVTHPAEFIIITIEQQQATT
ncbi:MAG TPA: phage tail sheath C-terminal domain-containing protein [Flavilitoribacter sp.]|nr:phage tail sheath C-terminal domain-containing protein [Flavilitoribacter sp.]